MLIVFFNTHGIVHKEFVHTCQAVSVKFHCEVLCSWRRAFAANIQTSGRTTIGFSTMTKLPLTHHSLFDNYWLPITLHWIPTPLFTWPQPLRLFSILQDECTAKRAPFWHDWADPHRIARRYRHTHIWELPGMHEIMGKKLGSLYTWPWGLLRRRSWKLGVTIRNFFNIQIHRILGSASYVIIMNDL